LSALLKREVGSSNWTPAYAAGEYRTEVLAKGGE